MRVVIAEDGVLLREGLGRLLADEGHEVVAAVGDALALVESVELYHPDVCVVDVRMPPSFQDEGLRAAVEIRSRWPGTPVLVLSQYVEERYATELLSNDTTAVGYLLSAWPTYATSSARWNGLRRAAPRSIRRWWPSFWREPDDIRTTSSPRESARS